MERDSHHFIPFRSAWIFPVCIYYYVYNEAQLLIEKKYIYVKIDPKKLVVIIIAC